MGRNQRSACSKYIHMLKFTMCEIIIVVEVTESEYLHTF